MWATPASYYLVVQQFVYLRRGLMVVTHAAWGGLAGTIVWPAVGPDALHFEQLCAVGLAADHALAGIGRGRRAKLAPVVGHPASNLRGPGVPQNTPPIIRRFFPRFLSYCNTS